MKSEKYCKRCDCVLNINDFRFSKSANRYIAMCKICENEYNRLRNIEYRKNNKDYVQNRDHNYYIDNKDKISERNANWKRLNKDKIKNNNKIYSSRNRNRINQNTYKWRRNKLKTNIAYKLSRRISSAISKIINKNGESSSKALPYTSTELLSHFVLLFEPWMNLKNYGVYDPKTWDDNDSNTWTWQIDHIIPASTFKYTSMNDKEFQECWALSNLRPYSAKQNILDGASKVRHKKNN